MMTIDERVQALFRDYFNDPMLIITDETTAEDIPSWDSLAHISLVFRIEEEFGVMFTGDEATALSDVGHLKRILKEKGA